MKNRSIAIVAMSSLLIAGMVAPGGVVAAATPKPTITAEGTVTCGGPGKAKLSPPLTPAAQPGTRTITAKFKWECVGLTGNPNVKVTQAKVLMTTIAPASVRCSTFVASHQGWSTTMKIVWKAAGGKIRPTTVNFSGAMVSQDPDIATMSGLTMFVPRIVNHAIPDPVSVTGSWSDTDNRFANLQVEGGLAGVQAGCASRKGLKKVTLFANSFVLTTVIV